MAENWLYQITLDNIADIHSLSLVQLYKSKGMIAIPSLSWAGTNKIQIDLVAADIKRKIIILSEAKEFLTVQGVSECAEQLTMKLFQLKYYLKSSLGKHANQISIEDLKYYQLLQYVSLGSYTGKNYSNAKSNSEADLKVRLDHYAKYLNHIGRSHIGIVLFANETTKPVFHRATLQNW